MIFATDEDRRVLRLVSIDKKYNFIESAQGDPFL